MAALKLGATGAVTESMVSSIFSLCDLESHGWKYGGDVCTHNGGTVLITGIQVHFSVSNPAIQMDYFSLRTSENKTVSYKFIGDISKALAGIIDIPMVGLCGLTLRLLPDEFPTIQAEYEVGESRHYSGPKLSVEQIDKED